MTSMERADGRHNADCAYDAVVVGAGPAGSATATHLARAGWRVALVDRATFPRDKPCAECLCPSAEPLLQELGVLDELEATRPARRPGFRIYAPDGSRFQGDFAATRDAAGRSFYETGMQVPRARLDTALLGAARRAGTAVYEGWRLGRLERHDGVYVLAPVAGGAPLRARLLVGADGVHSTVARRLDLHVPSRMRKVALVAHLRGIADLSDYVEMHVAGRRYVGIAPLEPDDTEDGRDAGGNEDDGPGMRSRMCNVALVVDETRNGNLLKGRAEAFLLEALATFPGLRGRLDGVTFARRTLTTSRLTVRARRVFGDGLLLVGDATGYYDPFTGEGIYRALRSARLAAEVAREALGRGDLGAAALARYGELYRAEFRGKRTIERIIQSGVQAPPLMDHIAARLRHRPWMADTIVAVTGDFLTPSAVLRPGYLLRLVV
jgi:flavin-dependent dehydrogenase